MSAGHPCGLHEPVQTLVNTFIWFSRPPRGKTKCKRFPLIRSFNRGESNYVRTCRRLRCRRTDHWSAALALICFVPPVRLAVRRKACQAAESAPAAEAEKRVGRDALIPPLLHEGANGRSDLGDRSLRGGEGLGRGLSPTAFPIHSSLFTLRLLQ